MKSSTPIVLVLSFVTAIVVGYLLSIETRFVVGAWCALFSVATLFLALFDLFDL